MKAFLAQPGFLSPYGNIAVDVSYLLALLATLMFAFGWWLARHGKGAWHRLLMSSASMLLLVYFFNYYLFRDLGGIAAKGKLGFGGPAWMLETVLEPVLIVHITLVVAVFLLIPYQLWLGGRSAQKREQGLQLTREELRLPKGIVWRILLPLAAVLLAIGSLRCSSGHCWLFYIGLLLLVAAALGLERLMERMAPEGDRRHRMIGTLTLSTILLLFASTTAMYVLLYVFYPHLETATKAT